MPWIVDGNNVAGGRRREEVRAAALDLARRERLRLVLFFDGAPPVGSPAVEHLGRVEVRYVANADRAILDLLGSGGEQWLLVSDDRELGRLARQRGATIAGASRFWSRLEVMPGEGERPREKEKGPTLDHLVTPEQRMPREVRHVRRRRRRG